MIQTGFGLRLKEAVKKEGISQKKLSEYLGISQDTITNYIKGKTEPGSQMLIKIASHLKVSPEWLMTGEIGNTTILDKEFAYRLKQIIDMTDWNILALARFSNTEPEVIERALVGEIPDTITMSKIAQMLDTSVEWLILGVDKSSEHKALLSQPFHTVAVVLTAISLLNNLEKKSFVQGLMTDKTFLSRIADMTELPQDLVYDVIKNLVKL